MLKKVYVLRNSLFMGIWATLYISCHPDPPKSLFKKIPPQESQIDFVNQITTDSTFNALAFEYIYNGGGCAAGDVNNDGLPDLFFTGNQVSSRLYINNGDFKFIDITLPSGIETSRWCTGIAMVDINDDGWMDLYISVAGFEKPVDEMANLLFINQGLNTEGIPTFIEQAADYGLADTGYSTQAAFFDYDLDGDLDVYLLTNALEKEIRSKLRPKRIKGEAQSTDRLFRNNGDQTFTDVSQSAGILTEGYGLGINISDINMDGYPDIYASNDFFSNDLLWVNQKDGTFINRADQKMKHQTHNGMGVDIADFNNDLLPDIAVLDMLPADHYRQKMMIPYVSRDRFRMNGSFNYEDQYMRNTLQLNRGTSFSELGNLAGISATDWSWSILFADFDHDALKDIFITNGYRKDVTNLDYISYSPYNQLFGTVSEKSNQAVKDLEKMPDIPLSNYLFKNQGDLSFQNVAAQWGLDQNSFSNGATYADLDLDGDLDLIINNIDQPASIYENTINSAIDSNHHYLRIQLIESDPDLTSYNTKIFVYTDDQQQYQELAPYRGYQSTVEEVVHFGVGRHHLIDSVRVEWLNGQVSSLYNIPADQVLTVNYDTNHQDPQLHHPSPALPFQFIDRTDSLAVAFTHATHGFDDFKVQRTLPHEHSQIGPAIAVGDINGDHRDDIFIGGNLNQNSIFLIQKRTGGFEKGQVLPTHSQTADALFFDADGDSDLDLYIVFGGTSAPALDGRYQDRLYLNDGNGHFRDQTEGLLPKMPQSGSLVIASDFDLDGDLDLFIGGRILPGAYPNIPQSYLLQNDGGQFHIVDNQKLANVGLVTGAHWANLDQDPYPELVLVGEWMPITIFDNDRGVLSPQAVTFHDQKLGTNVPTEGWWFDLQCIDIDADGDMDFVAGNIGLNGILQPTLNQPVEIYADDFDQNGVIDPLLTCYIDGVKHLLHERDLLLNQLPGMKRRFPNYDTYAKATFDGILTKSEQANASHHQAFLFESVLIENKGNWSFELHHLPVTSQLAPITSTYPIDLNRDNNIDLITVGNFYATETTQIGKYDASIGDVLIQTDSFEFNSTSPSLAGYVFDGNLGKLTPITVLDKPYLIYSCYGIDVRMIEIQLPDDQ